MRDEIVALDLETTGLDPSHDSIIEIGAVKFQEGRVTDTFQSLINPHRSLPRNIVALTGITQEEVNGAPPLKQVLPKLERFVGNRAVLGHNVSFDLGFLERQNALRSNLPLDTYELASVMLPAVPRYSLGALAAHLGVELVDAHRADKDAEATALVYWALWKQMLALPLNTLQEIVEASRGLQWTARPVFEAALEERARTAFTQTKPRLKAPSLDTGDDLIQLFGAAPEGWEPLEPNDRLEPLDIDALAGVLEPGGLFAETMPGYEYRPQQVDMLAAVAHAFNNGDHLLVEAGTGTGKSIAYLLPAIYWALQNNERVVISTNTINLQDQLIFKDIPALGDALNLQFRATVLKGRRNYLCPRRLAALRRRGPTSVDEMRVFAKILVWLLENTSGDRGEINVRGPVERSIWGRLSAEDEGCTMDRCLGQMGGACPIYKARQAAESAHVLIVNHALLLADVVAGNRVLPPYNYLIIDEAHNLEDAVTSGLSTRIDEVVLRRQLADLGSPRRGLLGDVLARTRSAIPARKHAILSEYVSIIHDAAGAMQHHIGSLFRAVYEFLNEHVRMRPSAYSVQVRIVDEHRALHGWARLQQVWDVIAQFTEGIATAMYRLARGMEDLGDYDIPAYDDLLHSVAATARHLEEVHFLFHAFIVEPAPNTIYWVEVATGDARLSIHAAPLDVGPLVEEHLWRTKQSIILTSATLQTAGSFEYIRTSLDAADDVVSELAIGSPFDYEQSTLLYLVSDIPEPNAGQAYQQMVEQGLIDLCTATEGRALVLFTSYTQLRKTSSAITEPLTAAGITVYDQGDGTSRQQLIEGLRETERAVLLGTRSFWEGVDVPGEALSVLGITRLPFTVPSDPIFAARSETYQNSFGQYALPEAILRFRQGFGRLIRTGTDRGVVVIFDRRLLSKRYGQAFLDSLPPCTVYQGPLARLAEAATRWLAGN
jgi:DNA polymerase-3 subunit epsilon/ATP-dependent DNA helicase DinG